MGPSAKKIWWKNTKFWEAHSSTRSKSMRSWMSNIRNWRRDSATLSIMGSFPMRNWSLGSETSSRNTKTQLDSFEGSWTKLCLWSTRPRRKGSSMSVFWEGRTSQPSDWSGSNWAEWKERKRYWGRSWTKWRLIMRQRYKKKTFYWKRLRTSTPRFARQRSRLWWPTKRTVRRAWTTWSAK